jgi:hypothetical protein
MRAYLATVCYDVIQQLLLRSGGLRQHPCRRGAGQG